MVLKYQELTLQMQEIVRLKLTLLLAELMFTARRPSNGALEMPAPRKRRSILQVLNRGAVAMRRASKPTLSHSPSSSGTDISAEGGMEAAIDALQHARQSARAVTMRILSRVTGWMISSRLRRPSRATWRDVVETT